MLCLQEIIFYLVELPVWNNELITKADFLIADCFVSAGRQNAYHDEKSENLTLLQGGCVTSGTRSCQIVKHLALGAAPVFGCRNFVSKLFNPFKL